MTASTLATTPHNTLWGAVSNAEPLSFLLGTHQPGWLSIANVPLFVSDRRLRRYRRLPHAAAPWACDSGGFTELQQYGQWRVTPTQYLHRLYRYRDEVGQLRWAAPQDWMCEPAIIHGGRVGPLTFAGTHLSVGEHQHRTVRNFLQLRDLAPDLPIIPVLQGWTREDYLRCIELYWSLGRVDLTTAALVGVGSICRRQASTETRQILTAIHHAGIHRLHGFGCKTLGLLDHGHLLTSTDSMAWSYDARRRPPLPDCTGHRNCANCLTYAHTWRTRLLSTLHTRPRQLSLLDPTPGGAT